MKYHWKIPVLILSSILPNVFNDIKLLMMSKWINIAQLFSSGTQILTDIFIWEHKSLMQKVFIQENQKILYGMCTNTFFFFFVIKYISLLRTLTTVFTLISIIILSYLGYCTILFDFNFTINLNLTLSVISEGFSELWSTKQSPKIAVGIDCNKYVVNIYFVMFSSVIPVKVNVDQKWSGKLKISKFLVGMYQ